MEIYTNFAEKNISPRIRKLKSQKRFNSTPFKKTKWKWDCIITLHS